MSDRAVKVFISYSWDSREHKQWVRKLSDDLNRAGIDTILDVKDMDVGDPIPEFMEKLINDCDFVLAVLTPNYKLKADKRLGGVGDESNIITADIHEKHNHRRYKTILASGTWEESNPTWARGKLGVDMSSEDVYEEGLERIIESCMRGRAKPKPQVKAETLTNKEYFDRGLKKRRAGDYEGAIVDLNKAIQLDPNFAVAYNNRGSAYNDLKQYDKAIVDYTKAIQLDPNYAVAYNNRGNAYYFLEHYDKAIADYTKAIDIEPSVLRYNNRANAYDKIGKHAKAEADRAKARELESRK